MFLSALQNFEGSSKWSFLMSGEMFISLPFGAPDMFLCYSSFMGQSFFLRFYSLGIPVLFSVALFPLSHKRNETAYNPRSKELTLIGASYLLNLWDSSCCQPSMPLLLFPTMYLFFRREALLSWTLACSSLKSWCSLVPHCSIH